MEKIVIVHRPTRLDSLVAKFNTRQQAKFYVEHLNADFSDYEIEHEVYYLEFDKLSKISQRIGNVQLIDWKYLPNFMFGKNDLVITIGQDGLVANTLKYLDGQKLIGINPDINRWDGVLSQFSVEESELIIKQTLNDESFIKQVTKAKGTCNKVCVNGYNMLTCKEGWIWPKENRKRKTQSTCCWIKSISTG